MAVDPQQDIQAQELEAQRLQEQSVEAAQRMLRAQEAGAGPEETIRAGLDPMVQQQQTQAQNFNDYPEPFRSMAMALHELHQSGQPLTLGSILGIVGDKLGIDMSAMASTIEGLQERHAGNGQTAPADANPDEPAAAEPEATAAETPTPERRAESPTGAVIETGGLDDLVRARGVDPSERNWATNEDGVVYNAELVDPEAITLAGQFLDSPFAGDPAGADTLQVTSASITGIQPNGPAPTQPGIQVAGANPDMDMSMRPGGMA